MNCCSRLARSFFAAGFQHRLGHFLNEQRDAVGALDDVLPNARRKQLVPDDVVDHGLDFAFSEPIDGESSYIGCPIHGGSNSAGR